jgi:hypothetical protein
MEDRLIKIIKNAMLVAVFLATPVYAAVFYEDFGGSWSGTYVCAQGKTGLQLDINAYYDHTMTARANFGAVGGGADVPSGSFMLKGRWDDDGTFVLSPDRWIDQPDGYSMIGFSGKKFSPMAGNYLSGDVFGAPGCSQFTVGK